MKYNLVKLNKKTKIAIISDLHLNMTLMNKEYQGTYSGRTMQEVAIEHAKYLKDNHINIYIINGDLSWEFNHLISYIETIEKETNNKIIIRYTIGNHELSKNFTIFEYLNHTTKWYLKTNPILIKDTLLFGTSGFFDSFLIKSYHNSKLVTSFLSELNERYFKKDKPLSLIDCDDIVKKDILDTQDILNDIKSKNKIKKSIFCMHYVPANNFYNKGITNKQEYHKYRNCFLGSDLYKNFIDKNHINVCYFGHNHLKQRNRTIGLCKYVTEPTLNYGDWVVYNYEPKDLKVQWEKSLQIISI